MRYTILDAPFEFLSILGDLVSRRILRLPFDVELRVADCSDKAGSEFQRGLCKDGSHLQKV